MQYRYLGNSGLQVSVLGFGNMVNCNDHDEEENVNIIKKAIELGINFFDTAEFYHFGTAETSLGRQLRKAGVKRENIVITTKLFSLEHEDKSLDKMG